jgi:hypothetical protein
MLNRNGIDRDKRHSRPRVFMRQIAIALISAQLYLGLARIASCDEPASGAPTILPLQSLTCPEALIKGCCDTYCPKPQPCITCYCPTYGANCYCRKPCPCVTCFRAVCGLCYCPKPCPNLCRPLAADFFTCAEGRPGCAQATGCGARCGDYHDPPARPGE